MVQARHGRGGHQAPGVAGRVVDLGFEPGQRLVLLLEGAATDEHGAVGQQDRVEVQPRQPHGRGGDVVGVARGQVDDADRVGGVGLIGLADGAAAADQHLLGLGRRQEHAGRLVADVRGQQVRDRFGGDGILGQVEDARLDIQRVVHPPAGEEHPSVGQQEQVGVQRQAGEAARELLDLPGVGGGRVGLQRLVEAGAGLIQAGGGEHPPVAERDQGRVPAPMLHRGREGPLLGGEVEHRDVLAALERAVVQRAPGRQHAAVGQEPVAAAEQVEGTPVGGPQRRRVGEVVAGGIPDHAGEDALVLVAEQRAVEPHPAAPRAGEEQHLAVGQQRGMHRQDPGVERQQLPGAVAGGVGVELQQLIQAGVLLRRVVDHEGDQLAGAAELGGGEAAALVLVGEPVRHPHPPSPAALPGSPSASRFVPIR